MADAAQGKATDDKAKALRAAPKDDDDILPKNLNRPKDSSPEDGEESDGRVPQIAEKFRRFKNLAGTKIGIAVALAVVQGGITALCIFREPYPS